MSQFRSLVVGAFVAAAVAASAQSLPTFVAAPEPLLSITEPMRAGSGRSVAIPTARGATGLVSGAQLNQVTHARRLTDGRIIVSLCSNQLRTFDARGAIVAQWQQNPANRGPMRRVFLTGDGVGAFEADQGTLFLLNDRLELVREVPLPSSFNGRSLVSDPRVSAGGPSFRSPLDVLGRLPDGRFVARVLAPPSVKEGVERQAVSVITFDDNGKILDSLAVKGPEIDVLGQATLSPRHVRFERTAVVAVVGARVFIGEQDQASIGVFDSSLKLTTRLPTITAPEPVTEAARAAWVAAQPTMFAERGTHWEFREPYAEAMPAYGDLVAGADERVWVQNPERPGSYPLVWTAYDGQRAVARAELPPRFFPTEFGADWVLGIASDAQAAQFVQLLRLREGPLTNRTMTAFDAKPQDRQRCDPWLSR
jgi:hypothetical protein